jgi:beta-lactamase regulating signal transducer with metallopeptidase domain
VAALLQIGLVNAALATLLACGVALISRKVRQPALIHLLWIIVLFRLVMFPIIEIPVEVPFPVFTAAASVGDASSVSQDVRSAAREDSSDRVSVATGASASTGRESASEGTPATDQSTAAQPGTLAALFTRLAVSASAAVSIWSAWLLRNIVAILGWTWLGGAVLWFLRQALTTLRYSRRLALATPAPAEVQQQADDLSRAMGSTYRPPVLIVRDVISPMLWGIGRNTRLLFPFDLLARLEPAARETLIAHELAHFRRRDHWVRAFELVVSGLFWWHPVVWWARREIEFAEEECCDAWVIEQFPRAPRCYAEALLTTLDFLSGETRILPPAAAGIGQVPFLKRRLTAIMRGVAPKAMSGPAWLAALMAAAVLLPCHPGLSPAAARPAPVKAFSAVSEIASAEVGAAAFDPRQLVPEWLTAPPPLVDVQEPVEPPFVAVKEASCRAVSPDGRYALARLGRDSGAVLRDNLSGKETDLSEYKIVTVAFSPDSQTFATGGTDRMVRLWACSTCEVLQTFRGHSGTVQSVVFSSAGKILISAGDDDRGQSDGSVKLWDIELGEIATLKSRLGPVNALSVSPDGRWLAFGTGSWRYPDRGGHVTVVDLATYKEHDAFPCELGIGAVAFKPDSNTLLAGDWKGRVNLWDVAEKRFLGITLPRYKDFVSQAQFSVDTHALEVIGLESIVEQDPSEIQLRSPLRIFFDQSASIAPISGRSSDATVEE